MLDSWRTKSVQCCGVCRRLSLAHLFGDAMGLALVHSRAVAGWQGSRVVAEVHLANGLPSFTLVGLADTEVREARERVRSAIAHSGLEFPSNQRITVNLAPADLPKDSGRFDLPIALGILAASGQLPPEALAGLEFAGELSLSGALRPVRGAMALALQAARAAAGAQQGVDAAPRGVAPAGLVLPLESAREAALVPGLRVIGATDLASVVQALLLRAGSAEAPTEPPPGWQVMTPSAPLAALQAAGAAGAPGWAESRCLSDVRGQAAAKRALEIAAAGGHSLLMVGPPGTGKSMLAQRLSGLLPPMTMDEALESAALASLAGRFEAARFGQRPLASPHHSASAVALVGGGSPPKPGEVSMAHQGVLFLDEMPEFARQALEALREPLETGCITIARAAHRAEFPARFQLVAAMNPCPCGHAGQRQPACRCSPEQVQRYRARLSGPLLDRIDLTVDVAALGAEELLQTPPGETSTEVSRRCAAARTRALQRQGCANAALTPADLDNVLALAPEARQFTAHASARLGWSARATHRALRVARTIADLQGAACVLTVHVAEAMQYRRAWGQLG